MNHPLPNGEKYYCFFRLRHHEQVREKPAMHEFHLHVESAYSRKTPPLAPHGNEKVMFGRLTERLMLAKN
jgi:hypothetical protein